MDKIKIAGSMLLGCFLLAAGVLIGFTCKQDSDGIFIHLFNPFSADAQPILKIGETAILIDDFDKISNDRAVLMISRLGRVKRDSYLAELLRDLRDKHNPDGPFATTNYEVTVNFSDENGENGILASACGNTLLRKFSLIADSGKRSVDCETRIELRGQSCTPSDKKIWISTKTAQEWLQIDNKDKLPKDIIVTATELGKIFP